MVYKPNASVMDLIMPHARKTGTPPQKVIEGILLAYYKEKGAKEVLGNGETERKM